MRIHTAAILIALALAAAACGKKKEEATPDDVASKEPATGTRDTGLETSDEASRTEAERPGRGGLEMQPEDQDIVREGEAGMNPILDRSLNRDPGPADEIAVVRTNMGTIVLRFFPKQAPLAVANFKGLAAKGYFNGVTFHRVIDTFMIQGGDPTGSGSGGESVWGGSFKDEFAPGLRFGHEGILAMANSGPATNGSQFFVTLGPQPHLNDKHTIFGEVMEGMDVVSAIGKTDKDGYDRPLKPVVIESVTIEIRGS